MSIPQCRNCEKLGHFYKNCPLPIKSFGIIAYKIVKSPEEEIGDHPKGINTETDVTEYPKIKFCLIQRAESIAFVDIIIGKYRTQEHLNTLIDELSKNEKNAIIHWSFDSLWNSLRLTKNMKSGYQKAKQKFSKIKKNLLRLSKTNYIYSEFGIPKGRKNIGEEELECAKREFEEETGYSASHFTKVDCDSFNENFVGTDGVEYSHIYYLYKANGIPLPPRVDINNQLQVSEVKSVGWFTVGEAISVFRDYDIEKKRVLSSVHAFVKSIEKN